MPTRNPQGENQYTKRDDGRKDEQSAKPSASNTDQGKSAGNGSSGNKSGSSGNRNDKR